MRKERRRQRERASESVCFFLLPSSPRKVFALPRLTVLFFPFFFLRSFRKKKKKLSFFFLHNELESMENAQPVVSASALPQQSHAWETVKENFKPLKKGRRPEELAPEVAPLGLACAAPPGAEEERRCVRRVELLLKCARALAFYAPRASARFSQRRAERRSRKRLEMRGKGNCRKKNCRISHEFASAPDLFSFSTPKITGSSRPSSSSTMAMTRSKCGSGTQTDRKGREMAKAAAIDCLLSLSFLLLAATSFSLVLAFLSRPRPSSHRPLLPSPRLTPAPPDPPPPPPNKNRKKKKQLHQVDPGHLQVRRLPLAPAALAGARDPGPRPGVPRR